MSRRSATPAYYGKRPNMGTRPTTGGTHTVNGTGIAPTSPRERMNKTEQRYADHLDTLLLASQISAWWFEAFSWRMADDTHYRPDFLIQRPNGALEVEEVKPPKKADFMTTPEAWVKLKVTAGTMPYPLTVVWQTKDGYWHRERLN